MREWPTRIAMVIKDSPTPAPGDQDVEVREVWREGRGCKGVVWSVAAPPFLLGFVPSVWDVFSDYDYADTWDADHRNITAGLEHSRASKSLGFGLAS